MKTMWRAVKGLVAMVLALTVGMVPACGTMGGGTKYMVEPASMTEAVSN